MGATHGENLCYLYTSLLAFQIASTPIHNHCVSNHCVSSKYTLISKHKPIHPSTLLDIILAGFPPSLPIIYIQSSS